MVVLNDYGYPPYVLIGNGLEWEESQLLCTVFPSGRPNRCGFGCGNPDYSNSFYSPAFEDAMDDADTEYCEDGYVLLHSDGVCYSETILPDLPSRC